MNDEEQFKKWLERAAKDSGSKISEAEHFLGLVSEQSLRDPLCALQIGYAVILGKPIVLMVDKDTKISSTLERVAQAIVRVDASDPKSFESAKESLAKFFKGEVS